MDNKNRFATRSLIVTLVFNVLLTVVLFWLGGETLRDQWLAVAAAAVVLTFALWFTLQQIAKPLVERVAAVDEPAVPAAPAPEPEPEQPAKTLTKPEHPYEASAVQMLSILQRKGRLVDFLQEDIQGYEDAQIGAAVRNVHAGCREALDEVVELKPVYTESEGSQVTIEDGFDPRAVRLTGQVAGDPPFQGRLEHRGWRVERIDLPEKLTADDALVVAPAEVEV